MEPRRFGKYRVLRRIASGGMSEVYLCLLPGAEGFRKRVAVKAVHFRLAADPRFRELFIREARLAASLSHPNLVQVFDFGKEGESYYLAMEYVEGWNLAEAAMQARRLGLQVPPGVWRHWIEGILSGLRHLHGKGVVHRDVSPANILVGRTGAVKLADFGVSRAASVEDGAGDARAGKASYFSPERARGDAASASSDLFAAGVISAELILGRRLFAGEGEREILERVRGFDPETLAFPVAWEGVARVVRKALAADPARRTPDAAEFLSALASQGPPRATDAEASDFLAILFPDAEEEVTEPSPQAPPGDTVAFADEAAGRRKRFGKKAAVGAVAGGVLLAAALAFLWSGQRPSVSTAPADGTPPPSARAAAATGAAAGFAPAKAPAFPAPEAGRFVLVLTDPEGVDILTEPGGSLGRTPARIDRYAVGARGIVLSMEGFERKRVPASALAGRDTFRTKLEAVLGTVDAIQAIPWARVYEGGRLLGDTPLLDVRLPVGKHRLRFVNEPLGVDKSESLTVRPGRNPKVIVRMTGQGP